MTDELDSAPQDALAPDAATGPAATGPAEDVSPPASAGKSGATSPADDVELLLQQAEAAIASVEMEVELPGGARPFELADLAGSAPSKDKASLELLRDVELDLRIELGRTQMNLEDVLQLRKGSVVPLEKLAGDPVDVYVNGRLVARGEILVLNDNFCVRVAELVSGHELNK